MTTSTSKRLRMSEAYGAVCGFSGLTLQRHFCGSGQNKPRLKEPRCWFRAQEFCNDDTWAWKRGKDRGAWVCVLGGFFDKEIRKLQQQNWVFKSTAVD